MSRRRLRIAAIAALIAGAAALVGGVVHAVLTATGSGSGFASTASLALTVNTPATFACTLPDIKPGDLPSPTSLPHTCQMSVQYSGSIQAFVSLTVQIQSQAGTGGTPLYDGTNSTGLTLSISDGHNTFVVPTNPGSTGGSCPAGFTCWTASNDLAATYSGSTPSLAFSNGNTATWTVTPVLQTTVGSAYMGGTALVLITAQAVQAPANALPSGCTTSTIGRPCPASGGFSWS